MLKALGKASFKGRNVYVWGSGREGQPSREGEILPYLEGVE